MGYVQKLRDLNPTSDRYFQIYEQLIAKGAARPKKRKEIGFYVESHHIFPKSLCTEDEKKDPTNKVFLTLKEHLLAHRILAKIFPHIGEFQRALFAMFTARTNKQKKGLMKIRDIVHLKMNSHHIFARRGESNGMYGRNHTAEAKAKIGKATSKQQWSEERRAAASQRQLGEDNPFFGRTHTEETKKLLREVSFGPKPQRRAKFVLTDPKGETFHFVGKDSFKPFCREHKLSHRKLCDWINKGIIEPADTVPKLMSEETRNCIGWKLEKSVTSL